MKNYIYLDGKKIEISDETAENLTKQFNKPKTEEIEEGTEYWYVDVDNEKDRYRWNNDNYDNNILKNHNLYLNVEDCDKQIAKNEALNKIKTYIKDNFEEFLPNWDDENEDKYNLYYDYEDEEWDYCSNGNFRELFLLPFLKSDEQVEQVIKDCKKELDILIK